MTYTTCIKIKFVTQVVLFHKERGITTSFDSYSLRQVKQHQLSHCESFKDLAPRLYKAVIEDMYGL